MRTPVDWRVLTFSEAFEVAPDCGRRVGQRDYLGHGALPVVDQGQDLIGGYTDDVGLGFQGSLPVIVFGDHTRRVKLVDFPFAVGAQGVKLLNAAPCLSTRFAYWMLQSVRLDNRGYGRHFALLRKELFAVPPLAAQRRIVDILEDHLSHLDAAEQGLCLSLQRLASYEAAALSRCRGGDERPLSALTEIQGGLQKQPKRAPKQNAYSYLRVANVTKEGLQLDDVHLVELFEGELDRLRLRMGDLLVVEGNGSASQIGRAALWDGSIEDCVHQNHLIRVRAKPGLSPFYLEAVWNSPQNRKDLTDLASSSSGLHTLSVSKLKCLTLPLPTLERQQELVAQLRDVGKDEEGSLRN